MTNLPAEKDDDAKYMMKQFNSDGTLCTIDMRTGEVVHEWNKYHVTSNNFKYSVEWSDIICNEIRKGKSISAICAQSGFPSASTVYQWKNCFPDFKRSLSLAREDRAEQYADMALEIAMNIPDKDAAQVAKVQIDTLKWHAEKGNPVQYGASTKITGDMNAPVGFAVISTGIQKETQRDVEIEEKHTVVDTTCTEVPAEEEL